MKNIIIAIREQQLIVEKLIAKYRQEGGDDLFFAIAELERKNAELSAAVAKHISDSAPNPDPEPAVTPFDPTFAPPGCVAKVTKNGCIGCVFGSYLSDGCLKSLAYRICFSDRRPDGTSALFVKKETP